MTSMLLTQILRVRLDRIVRTGINWQPVRLLKSNPCFTQPDRRLSFGVTGRGLKPCQLPAIMVNAENLKLYLAVKKRDDRSQMEDSLVLDGFNIRAFGTAAKLWDAFQRAPARSSGCAG